MDNQEATPSPYTDFVENPADALYYNALELLGGSRANAKQALKLLDKALEIGTNNIQTHIGFVCTCGYLKDTENARRHILEAFAETKKQFPKWPKHLIWGHLEHRAPLRAIQYRAELYHDEKDERSAVKLYRLLLRLNPNDNQGVRYVLAGIHAGISGEQINAMFDEGNAKQNWDALEHLVRDQNKKHRFWKAPREE